MEAEGRRNIAEATGLFAQSWTQSTNNFERCIAAHYVARHQPTAELVLHWNQEALNHARQVCDGGVDEFFASLYLNLGKSYEVLGNTDDARELYQLALGKLQEVPAGAYRAVVEDGIRRGMLRVSDSGRPV